MHVVDTRCSKGRGKGTGRRREHRTCIGCLFNGHLCRVTRRSSTKNDSTDSNAEKVPTPPSPTEKKNPPRSRPDPVPGSLPAQRLISPPHPSEKKKRSRSLTPLKILPCDPLQNQVSHLRSRTVPRVTNFRVATPHFRRPIEGLSKQATRRRYKTHILPIHSRSRFIRQSKISLAKQPPP